MIPKKYIILTLLPAMIWIGTLIYLNQQNKKTVQVSDPKGDLHLDGMVLMDKYCFACHHPEMSGGHAGRTGPPMFKVREHYFREGISREDFVNPIIAYVQHPDQEKSKMPGAIRNFGLMPPLTIDQEELERIVNYIYEHDLSSEEWKDNWRQFKKQTEANADSSK